MRVSATTVDSLGATQLVTAVRLFAGDEFKIIGWKMEPNGSITRLSDTSAGAVRAISAASVRGRCFVLATRETNNHLKVRYWLFPNSAAGPFEHKADITEGLIADPDDRLMCLHFPGPAQNLGDTVVAARGNAGQLRLWRYHVAE